jgi:hypothetical protein
MVMEYLSGSALDLLIPPHGQPTAKAVLLVDNFR